MARRSSSTNVVNSGLSGVTDLLNGATYIGNAGSAVTTSLPLYNVDWYLAGAESGFTNSLVAPGVSFSEADQNTGPFPIGTSVNQTNPLLQFTLQSSGGAAVTNGANSNFGSGVASLVFSYLEKGTGLTWSLTTAPTDWFLFGFNDNGGPDADYDDFVGIAHVSAVVAVPLPGAFLLFAGGVGLLGLKPSGPCRRFGWPKPRRMHSRRSMSLSRPGVSNTTRQSSVSSKIAMRYWPSTTSRQSTGNIAHDQRYRKLVRHRASPHGALEGMSFE
jgi:hypothetical protein